MRYKQIVLQKGIVTLMIPQLKNYIYSFVKYIHGPDAEDFFNKSKEIFMRFYEMH